MAFATTNFALRPESGWVLIATNPAFLRVGTPYNHPWEYAITPGPGTPPAATVTGVPMGRDMMYNSRELMINQGTAIVGEVYIRVSPGAPMSSIDTFNFSVVSG